MQETKLVSPYRDIDKARMTVTSITVADKDRALIMALYPEPSCLQVTLCVLLDKLASSLRERGMTEYNPDEYVRLVNESKLVMPEAEVVEEPVEQHKKGKKVTV